MASSIRERNTKYYNYFNANPKDRLGGDCVIRAISSALNQSWETTVRELTELGISLGYVLNDKHCFEKYLKVKGWTKMKQPRKRNNTKYTGEEFCRCIQNNTSANGITLSNNILANIGGHHITAIKSGVINDIWNCSQKTIGNYWVKL